MTPDTSGPTWLAPLASYDPDTSSWRTSGAIFPSDWPTSSETCPAWGMTRGGELYALPTPALLTGEPASSSLLGTPTTGNKVRSAEYRAGRTPNVAEFVLSLLPTPQAHDAVDGKTAEQVAAMRARTGAGVWNLNEVAANELALLPTPVSDNSRGLPQPGTDYSSLPNAVMALMPTPRAQNGEERNQTCWVRPLGEPQNLENALARLPGVSTPPPSPAGSASPEPWHPAQLSLDGLGSD